MKIGNNSYNVGIGLCTFKRFLKLELCLDSLYLMKLPLDVNISIIIADNDKSGSAYKIVKHHKINNKFQVFYEIEETKGIPFARNKVLNIAKQQGIKELAFIDDDETVDKDWLIVLWDYYCKTEIDVVWGWVKTIYPKNTPKWIIDGKFFQLPENISGKSYNTAYTNNVLFNFEKLVIQQNLFFDPQCGSMGEDEDFFIRASNKGNIIHFLSEAIVYEILEDNRMKASYYLKRLFYTKNNRIIFQNLSFLKRLSILKSGILDIFRFIFKFTEYIFSVKKYKMIESMGFLVSAFAKIAGFFNLHFKIN